MNRNFDFEFKSFDSKTIVNPENGEPLSLKAVSIGALMMAFEDERNLGGEEKFKRYTLAIKINAGGNVEVSAEDVALLKKLIGKGYTPLIVGQAYLTLEEQS